MIQRMYLIVKELFSSKFVSMIVLLAIVSSSVIVGIFDVAGSSLNTYLREKFAGSIPPNTIKVSPRQTAPSILSFLGGDGPAGIGEGTLRRIRGLRGVIAVHPLVPSEFPMEAGVSFFGIGYRSDILAVGAPFALIGRDLKGPLAAKLWKRAAPGSAVPVLVPRGILQAYNDGMAGPNKLPRISEKMALGARFRILFGQSSLRSLEGHTEETAVIAGFTESINVLALIIPDKVALEYNRRFNSGYLNSYSALYVRVGDHQSLVAVSDAIRQMGLSAEAERDLSRNILQLQRNIAIISGSLKYLIMVLSLIAVSFATVIAAVNRTDYYRIMRIVGASAPFITVMILVKYTLIGIAGSLCGLYLVRLSVGRFLEAFQLAGILSGMAVSDETARAIVIYGIILPVISTVPALFRLYAKGLNRD